MGSNAEDVESGANDILRKCWLRSHDVVKTAFTEC
jgi:hypothetical protein